MIKISKKGVLFFVQKDPISECQSTKSVVCEEIFIFIRKKFHNVSPLFPGRPWSGQQFGKQVVLTGIRDEPGLQII